MCDSVTWGVSEVLQVAPGTRPAARLCLMCSMTAFGSACSPPPPLCTVSSIQGSVGRAVGSPIDVLGWTRDFISLGLERLACAGSCVQHFTKRQSHFPTCLHRFSFRGTGCSFWLLHPFVNAVVCIITIRVKCGFNSHFLNEHVTSLSFHLPRFL